MAEFRHILSSIFNSDAEALVNPTNCMGINGAGLAKAFAHHYPSNAAHYRRACIMEPYIYPGQLVATRVPGQPMIINLPTKNHWAHSSNLEDIEEGIRALAIHLEATKVKSVAIPKLGCGLGGLEWSAVRPLITKHLAGLPDLRVDLHVGNK